MNSLNPQKVISSAEDVKAISRLTTEINKEDYSLEIKKEIESSLSSAIEKTKKSEAIFKKIVEEAKKDTEQKLSKSRGKRNLDGIDLEEEVNRSLSPQERQGVSTFYREFSELKGKSQDFQRRLEEIEQGKKPTKKKISNPKQEALDSLNQIGWNRGGNINFQDFLNHHWWDHGNPYVQIIDPVQWEIMSQSYKDSVKKIKEVKENGGNRACSVTIGLIFSLSESYCYRDAQGPEKIKKAIEK